MSNYSPITPPPELVQQLSNSPGNWLHQITNAYQAGADQELEACCEWLAYEGYEHEHLALRAARRLKPPSLKDQALKELRQLPIDPELGVCASALDTIRRALEALPE